MNTNRDQPSPRALVRACHTLRDVEPPATLLPAVLRLTGLADSYLPLETPVGTVFVTWSARGVTAVMLRRSRVRSGPGEAAILPAVAGG